jgi:hypothetical protein
VQQANANASRMSRANLISRRNETSSPDCGESVFKKNLPRFLERTRYSSYKTQFYSFLL